MMTKFLKEKMNKSLKEIQENVKTIGGNEQKSLKESQGKAFKCRRQ